MKQKEDQEGDSPAAQVSRRLPSSLKLNTADTMSDAEVKNDVAAEAPSAEELKAQKRSAEVYFHCYSRLNTYMWPGQPCPSLTMLVVFVNL